MNENERVNGATEKTHYKHLIKSGNIFHRYFCFVECRCRHMYLYELCTLCFCFFSSLKFNKNLKQKEVLNRNPTKKATHR